MVKAEKISRLVTRFYFKEEIACYEIIVKTDQSREVVKSFDNYASYRKVFNKIIEARQKGMELDLP